MKKLWKGLRQEGMALMLTLIVMLLLTLLALSLVLQSNTEHLISQNEQDAFQALSFAEAALDQSNRIIKNYVATRPYPDDLDFILAGNLVSPARPNILGLRAFDETLGPADLDTSNEATVSVLETINGKQYEVFRMGDTSGPRALLKVRVEDNYDDGGGVQNTDDTDFRVRVHIISEYPVFTRSDGTEFTSNVEVRPRARRDLIGRFAPSGQYAIRTDGDLEIWGSTQLCGECGSAHANGAMRAARNAGDTISVCGEATGTGDFEQNGGTIFGDQGLSPEIFIPIINPYHPDFVPQHSNFDQTVTLRDASPGPQYDLTCPQPSATDPGSSKYFALVRTTSGGQGTAQVWKAYPDTSDPDLKKWYWRLIDEDYGPGPSPNATIGDALTATLDNCGRVVSCNANIGCTPDAIYNSGTGLWDTVPAGSAVTDAGNAEFYGWQSSQNYATDSCSGDNISGIVSGDPENRNDWWTNNFLRVTSTAPYSVPPATAVSARVCGGSTCPGVPQLPGTGAQDNVADFNTASVLRNPVWTIPGGTVYSPLYGAVIFVYGHTNLSGNLGNIKFNNGNCNSTGCAAGAEVTISNAESDPPSTWKVTAITYGHVDLGGGVRYSPAFGATINNYQFAIVAGRDIKMHGTTNSFGCNTTDCDGTPTGTTADYSGIFVMHEQLDASGNVGVNGFMIAEDRVDCDNFVQATGGNLSNQGHGSVQVHYDCTNPSDPWRGQSTRLREWEELQE